MVHIIFQPNNKKIKVAKHTKLIQAAELAGVYLDTPCGGHGSCGKCRVHILPIDYNDAPIGKEYFTEQEWQEGWRLACQVFVNRDIEVFIPEPIRELQHKILHTGLEINIVPDPNIKKYFLILDPPNLAHQKSDWEILSEKLENATLSFQQDRTILSKISRVMRESNYRITVTLTADGKLIDIEPGNTVNHCYGIAFDIGTTTVVGTLLDLTTGKELAVSAEMNAQSIFGADVVSRIQFAIQEVNGTNQLHHKIVDVVNHIIQTLCKQAKINRNHIYELTVVGNTTMQHLFLNLSPATLGTLPYVPIFKFGFEVSASELRIRSVNPRATVYILPNIAGFVGADTVGVILATDSHNSTKTRLIIDLGTNSEIVLGNKNELLCCSAAAGPAFEAAHIEQGMRAASGAIDHVWIENGDIRISTIENQPPCGICGTGIIDAVAIMVNLGIIDASGRIIGRNELRKNISERIKNRIIEEKKGNKFVICTTKNIYLTQQDIREVQLAKSAIATGIEILKKQLNIGDDQIDEVLLAGAFGHYILPESVLAIGLIPKSLSKKIISIGNAASCGAKLALLSLAKRRETLEIAKKTRHFELALHPEFESRFADSLSFPA
ncbi:MAG: ASKHA domain-containing protein [bacterium]|nr:ASKHA domain-containing protein [bacterium]